MDIELNDVEARVLGCLLEKEMATPEYYPLSLNSLVNACNQKSNRYPVVNYDDKTAFAALASLRKKQLVHDVTGDRVPKYGQNFTNVANVLKSEGAIIAVLLLRGPQTPGELRTRTERLYKFETLEEVEESISELADAGLVVKLPRMPGQKESRYAHLMSGPVDIEEMAQATPAKSYASAGDDVARIEEEVKNLREELEELKKRFNDFKAQFE